METKPSLFRRSAGLIVRAFRWFSVGSDLYTLGGVLKAVIMLLVPATVVSGALVSLGAISRVIPTALLLLIGSTILVYAIASLVGRHVGHRISGAVIPANAPVDFGALHLDELRARAVATKPAGLTIEERNALNALREKWDVATHNAMVEILNGLMNAGGANDRTPPWPLLLYPRRFFDQALILFEQAIADSANVAQHEAGERLTRLMIEYMDSVRWLHAACEVMDPALAQQPGYAIAETRWEGQHETLRKNLAALARRDDWPGLAEQLKRVDWSPRFSKYDGKTYVGDLRLESRIMPLLPLGPHSEEPPRPEAAS